MPPTETRDLKTPRQAYIGGLADGVHLAFDHIEGKVGPEVLADAIYTGPLPPELTDYIARIRDRMATAG